jgi:tetratricopeptide (TPR) repeat protein
MLFVFIQTIHPAFADVPETKSTTHWQQPPLYTVEATNIPMTVIPPTRNRVILSKLRSDSSKQTNAITNAAIKETRSLSELSVKANTIDTNHIARLNRLYIINAIKRNNALFRVGDHQQACDNLKQLMTTTEDPELIQRILSLLGVLNFKLRQFETAAVFFAQAMEYAPGNTQLACNLAGAYLSYGALDKAEEALLSIDTNLILADSLKAAVHFNLACIHSLKGQPDDALNNLATAAECDPVFTATNIGDTQLDRIRRLKRFERIQRELQRILNSDPDPDEFINGESPFEQSVESENIRLQQPVMQPVESNTEEFSLPAE